MPAGELHDGRWYAVRSLIDCDGGRDAVHGEICILDVGRAFVLPGGFLLGSYFLRGRHVHESLVGREIWCRSGLVGWV